MSFDNFSSLAPVVILLGGAETFEQFWQRTNKDDLCVIIFNIGQ